MWAWQILVIETYEKRSTRQLLQDAMSHLLLSRLSDNTSMLCSLLNICFNPHPWTHWGLDRWNRKCMSRHRQRSCLALSILFRKYSQTNENTLAAHVVGILGTTFVAKQMRSMFEYVALKARTATNHSQSKVNYTWDNHYQEMGQTKIVLARCL
jgi:hypothetical protein